MRHLKTSIRLFLCAAASAAVPVLAPSPPLLADMMRDSPVTFPATGALPSKHPTDVKTTWEKPEADYALFGANERSIEKIDAIQAEMVKGTFTPPATDWARLPRTRKILAEGGDLHVMAVGDSIVADTMRSAWLAKLQQAYPKAKIRGTVYVRGGGGCQHYREAGRVQKNILPRKPDLVFLGGISQRDVESIREVIRQIRAGLPDVEILLATGTFGDRDPRVPKEIDTADHSGTGEYGRKLRQLAADENCAFLDMTTPWVEYLRSANVHPHTFYRDRVHANEYGEQILSKILMSFFRAE